VEAAEDQLVVLQQTVDREDQAAADLQALAEQLDLAEAEQEEVLVEVQVMLILEAAQAEETLA
jgi:hypothetical protein